jgi:hypothetical protein
MEQGWGRRKMAGGAGGGKVGLGQKKPGTVQPWSPVPYRLAAVMPQKGMIDLKM